MGQIEESKIRYLEMIQGVITRMASNSFSLKSWTVTLVAGVLALSSKDTDKTYLLIALIPVLVFWFLDAYYLQLERKYRALFNYVRKDSNAMVDFNLNLKGISGFELKERSLSYIACLISRSEWLFYVPTGLIVLVVMKITHVI